MNQKEIAERLNLSRTTVSRCFTNHPKINPETRARVFELAAEMGYEYSPPRNLTADRNRMANSVAVLAGVPRNAGRQVETAREVLAGISERLAAEKLTLNVHYVDPGEFDLSPRARRILPGLRNAHLLGFILLYPFKEESVGNLVTKFPTVCVLNDFEELDVDCVDVDQTRGIIRMVRHLVELGHRELGFLSWKYKVPTPWVERRFGAFVESLYRFHLSFREDRVINVHRENQIEVEEVEAAARRMIEGGVTGIVCAADHQAYHLVQALRESGIRVPEDVSVTGFDGEEPPPGMDQLTTVRTPFRDIGVSSVVSLLRRVTHPSASRRHILVSGRPLIGATTAAPRK
ncbi:MAG: LacI family DNA-binding transcriptional regulator [Oceanipulchritudo sp.]